MSQPKEEVPKLIAITTLLFNPRIHLRTHDLILDLEKMDEENKRKDKYNRYKKEEEEGKERKEKKKNETGKGKRKRKLALFKQL